MRFNSIDWAAQALVIIGGINWGLVSLFDFDLVAWLLGDMTFLSRVVYGLVGLSAVYLVASLTRSAQVEQHTAVSH